MAFFLFITKLLDNIRAVIIGTTAHILVFYYQEGTANLM